jgi:hypothetical protein
MGTSVDGNLKDHGIFLDHCITAQSGDMEEDEFMSGRKKTGKMCIAVIQCFGAIAHLLW